MWEMWYAWYPVELANGNWTWFSVVERRLVPWMESAKWIYREAR